MKLLEPIQKSFSKTEDSHLKLLFPEEKSETRKETVYRRNGVSIDKIIEFDADTGMKVKTTHYDYFNDKKIRSIDEYDSESGKKLRTINYVLYKSIDEYDLESGKKIRTINFNVRDESKISSIQEYDLETGNIIRVFIYKRDGKTVSIIKNLETGENEHINKFDKKVEYNPIKPSEYFTTRSYDNIEMMDNNTKECVAELIDNLYKDNSGFENLI